MSHLLQIFVAGFGSVFLLGFQSRAVNHGNYGWAACGSFVIAITQGFLWSRIMAPGAGLKEYMVYGLSGACGITAAMWTHRKFLGRAA
jgi:hypothetical protein